MKLHIPLNLRLEAGLLAPAVVFLLATSAGANGLDAFTPAADPSAAKETNPQIDAAGKRVESAKAKLDQARQQLAASRAMLKACEAEYKAARADKEALSLRTEATKLADASGLKDNGAQPVQPDASIKSFEIANPAPVTAAPDLSQTRIQQPDATAQVQVAPFAQQLDSTAQPKAATPDLSSQPPTNLRPLTSAAPPNVP